MLNLSSEDRRQIILALQIAIGSESKAISGLESDIEFRSFREAIEERRRQIDSFEKVLRKVLKLAS